MYRAALDTCALVPGRQPDVLRQLATEETYATRWGSGILFELDYVLARLDAKPGRDGGNERRRHLFQQMKRAFPGAEIGASKDREHDYDPDDVHVARAAILETADAIVTDDSRAGFKTLRILSDAGIDIVHPHEFAANTVAAHPEVGVRALVAMSRPRVTPPRSPLPILEGLRDCCGMDEVAKILTSLLPEVE